jgi:hypothetical protein
MGLIGAAQKTLNLKEKCKTQPKVFLPSMKFKTKFAGESCLNRRTREKIAQTS